MWQLSSYEIHEDKNPVRLLVSLIKMPFGKVWNHLFLHATNVGQIGHFSLGKVAALAGGKLWIRIWFIEKMTLSFILPVARGSGKYILSLVEDDESTCKML